MLLALLTLAANADDLDGGRSIYVARCQSCHGATGRGDGPASAAFAKKPRDFSAMEYWSSMTDDQLRLYIIEGKPGTIMRGFPMADEQVAMLMMYLRSFPTTAPAAPTPKP